LFERKPPPRRLFRLSIPGGESPGAFPMPAPLAASRTVRPTLGLIGYGAFGRLIHPLLAEDFDVVVYDSVGSPALAGVRHGTLAEAAAADIVVLAVPVNAMQAVARTIAPHLTPGALVLDVGSVKCLPARVLAETLPDHVAVVGTHPLFGPQSFSRAGAARKVVLCPVRGERAGAVRRWLRAHGFTVVTTSPEAHDRDMALAQGMTHMVARLVADMVAAPRMTTPSFDLLRAAADMVSGDSPAVFDAILRDNPYAPAIQARFFGLADALRRELAGGAAGEVIRSGPASPRGAPPSPGK
jgi:prephenate dehydrogenase